MYGPQNSDAGVQFGVFEVDLRARELRKHGRRVRIQDKPFDTLAILIERSGELVTREELRQRLWPADTFVVFDDSLNTAVRKLREVLGDSAESPRFVETIPRHGYRFIAPINRATPTPATLSVASPPQAAPSSLGGADNPFVAPRSRFTSRLALFGFLLALAGVGLSMWFLFRTGQALNPAGHLRVMLAVLPFENLSGNPLEEYFADGMTEELITHLARIDPTRLGVIGRTSSMHFKGSRATIAEIGDVLGVEYLLEGSVRRDAGLIRVTAQLIRVSDQTHAWTETYDRDLASMLEIQSAVATRVAESLSLALLDRPARAALMPEAHEAYLRGRFHWNKRTPDDLKTSLEFFRRAIEIQPTHALAYAGLADAHNMLGLGEYAVVEPRIAAEAARRAATRAIELDGSLAEAHASLGFVQFAYDWNWLGAEAEFGRAIELNAGYPTAHHWYANFLGYMGRFSEAITEIEAARRLDPLSLIINADEGYILHLARRDDEAIARLESTLKMDSHFSVARCYLGMAYEQVGRVTEAIVEYRKAMADSGSTVATLTSVAFAQARAGNRQDAQGILRLLQERATKEHVDPAAFAYIYSALGETDRALGFLERAYEERSDWLVELKVTPSLDPLRPNPRFIALLRKMNLE